MMLEIRQTANYKNYSQLIDTLGIGDEIISIAEAYEGDRITGFAVYHFSDEMVIIDHAESGDDLYLFDGIIRSVLFLAMTKGIEEAMFNLASNEEIIKLHFVKGNEKCIHSISDFMNNCKNCGL